MKAAMAKYDQGGRRDLLAVAKGVQSAAEKALGGKFETVSKSTTGCPEFQQLDSKTPNS